jgi:hypothetical protein
LDQLLASPQYGGRWGRHWLNLGRFAEDDVRSLGPESVLYALPQDARY